ncbi:TBC1 domain family member 5 isoform X2 [Epargyreus clarus]|uniref:TBC1 domain family member 5 isoform X2 n=1 Tax=Epargyreus clarus TaxID=520877 RepID=UPI003C2FAE43
MESDHSNGPSSPVKHIEASDYDLQFPTWSIDFLRNAALHLRLVRPRSLAWAIMLNALPAPSGDIITSIKSHRNFYDDLKEKLSMDPRAVIGDDPLSQNDESAWKQHFCDNELKALILQDVVRTFPDEVYFRDKDIQDLMVRILFFWARSHPSPGYRQGMHEVLAPLLYELHSDRKYAPDNISDTLRYYLDTNYLEHDSFMLFSAVMKGVERFYSTGDVVPTSCGRLPISKSVHSQNEVVRYLEAVREQWLRRLDAELAAHLARCGVALELFGMSDTVAYLLGFISDGRWLRLLFGREFPRSEIPHLWGFLFSDGPSLANIHYLIVAMLISIRDTLLQSDAGGVLATLMRPVAAGAAHACALALHLRAPLRHARPPPPPPPAQPESPSLSTSTSECGAWGWEGLEQAAEGVADGAGGSSSGSEGVAEGGDVARSLAALALLRARLPPAAAALRAALPRVPPQAALPLQQIMQLAALLQCRNHALIDVETALEAAENQPTDEVGRKQLVPVSLAARLRQTNKQTNVQTSKQAKIPRKVKEVPLKVFHQIECDSTSDLPFLDPLRLRTE